MKPYFFSEGYGVYFEGNEHFTRRIPPTFYFLLYKNFQHEKINTDLATSGNVINKFYQEFPWFL